MERISTFAKRLKLFREENNMTLQELEKITGIPNQTLSRYENGQRIPKVDVATNIAFSIKVDPLWLQGYDVSRHQKEYENTEMDFIIQQIKDRPEMHTLFSKTSKASKETVEKTIKMLEIFKETNNDL